MTTPTAPTTPTTAPLTSPALASLPPHVAQSVFRVVLEALARPGTGVWLPDSNTVPPALLPVLALADLDTPVQLLSDDDWGDLVGTATGAPTAGAAPARFVAALRPLEVGEAARFPIGSAASPESGALVVLAVPSLTSGPRRALRGPGVPGSRTVAASGIAAELWAVRAAAEFPAGFDLLLVDPDGQVVGIPRSTRIEEH